MNPFSTLLLIASGSLLFFACGDTSLNVGQDPCLTDADCVPAGCCHVSQCEAKSKGAACTLDCTSGCHPGTMDCGGGCVCHGGHCAALVVN